MLQYTTTLWVWLPLRGEPDDDAGGKGVDGNLRQKGDGADC
jgi:hypothetical protein